MKIDNCAQNLDLTAETDVRHYFADGKISDGKDVIVREHTIELYINEQLTGRLVCTPEYLAEMIVGRLVTDGYIRNKKDIDVCYICEYGKRARVFLKNEPFLETTVQTEPTCCTDNRIFLKNACGNPLLPLRKADWNPEWVFRMADRFAEDGRIHKTTWGTHGCYLSVDGEIVFHCEDIGRHNALDKAIGWAVLHDCSRESCMLYTTGRIPCDMVRKAVAAGIPVMISKAVPTKEAVEMAAYYNLTLICKAWPDKFEVMA